MVTQQRQCHVHVTESWYAKTVNDCPFDVDRMSALAGIYHQRSVLREQWKASVGASGQV